MNSVYVSNLDKKYKDVHAVRGISFSIEEGEIFAMLGENGAGKSTTVKILCGLDGDFSGEVKVLGYDVKTEAINVKKSVNFSPQETAVAPNMTVKENLEFIARLYGFNKKIINEKIEKIAEKLKLIENLNRKAKTLSGGTKRRLSIAMALISEPKLLFLDEPSLGLDVLARRELFKTVKELKGTITVFLTTHYIEEAEKIADKVAIISKGKIVATGSVSEIKNLANSTTLEDAFVKLVGGDYE